MKCCNREQRVERPSQLKGKQFCLFYHACHFHHLIRAALNRAALLSIVRLLVSLRRVRMRIARRQHLTSLSPAPCPDWTMLRSLHLRVSVCVIQRAGLARLVRGQVRQHNALYVRQNSTVRSDASLGTDMNPNPNRNPSLYHEPTHTILRAIHSSKYLAARRASPKAASTLSERL